MSAGAPAGWRCRVVARTATDPPLARTQGPPAAAPGNATATPQAARKAHPIPHERSRDPIEMEPCAWAGLPLLTSIHCSADGTARARRHNGGHLSTISGPSEPATSPHAGAWMHPLCPARRYLVGALLAVHRQKWLQPDERNKGVRSQCILDPTMRHEAMRGDFRNTRQSDHV